MRKVVCNAILLVIAILAVDIMVVPLLESLIDRNDPDTSKVAVAVLDIIVNVSSFVRDFVDARVEGMSASELVDVIVVSAVVVIFIIFFVEKNKKDDEYLVVKLKK